MVTLKIGEIDGEICLRLDKSIGTTYTSMFEMFYAWDDFGKAVSKRQWRK